MSERLDSKSDIKEFLLKEYDHVATSLWKSEEAGETRLNWFIGIIGAVMAGTIALGTGEHAIKDVK